VGGRDARPVGPPGLTDDAQTVVTELVTNSVQAGAGEIGVLIEWHRGVIEIRVWDDAPGEPRLGRLSTERDSGPEPRADAASIGACPDDARR
jgi:anti-sigma regulatory factor (Ser/Thr protein kinase)